MFNLPSPLEKINLELASQKGVDLYIKRDDLIHTEVSGNKWRKLKLNIEKFKQNKYDAILTFGGAYSNHIAATASAGQILGIKTIGIIRGEELNPNSNDTLKQAQLCGMHLDFVSRQKYSERYERIYHEALRRQFGNVLIINEGGANFYGMLGCVEIVNEMPFEPDYYYLASGTGTTTAGLLFGSNKTIIRSVPVFKNGGFMEQEVKSILSQAQMQDYQLLDKMNLLELKLDFHFGGYGKFNQSLIDFINEFYAETGLKLDQIYTAKMMSALLQDLKDDNIKQGSKVVAIHTGGLQGLSSIKEQLFFD